MQKILEHLQAYTPIHEQDASAKQRCLELIGKPNCFERIYDHGGHFTASAFVTNETIDKMLLVHHAKLNKWVQPGGHCDGSSDVYASAMREVEEETGLKNLRSLMDGLFDIDLHLIPAFIPKNEPEHWHYDLRYAFIANENDPLLINHESSDLGWFSFDQVKTMTQEQSVLRMIDKVKKLRETIFTEACSE